MTSDAATIAKINKLKSEMGVLWDKQEKMNHNILELSIQIDKLLNQYDWLKVDWKNEIGGECNE
mgnify:CR=1 FL=1